jgi:hypothetical protein
MNLQICNVKLNLPPPRRKRAKFTGSRTERVALRGPRPLHHR